MTALEEACLRALVRLEDEDAWVLRAAAGARPRVLLDRFELIASRANAGLENREQIAALEFTDADPESEVRARTLERVFDVVEALREPMVADAVLLRKAVRFLLWVLDKPQGKNQRKLLVRVMRQACTLLSFFLARDPRTTRAIIIAECQGAPDNVTGMFSRTLFYNPEAKHLKWLRDNWNTYEFAATRADTHTPLLPLHKHSSEELFRAALVAPALLDGLEQALLARLGETHGGSADSVFVVRLVLLFAFHHPPRILAVARGMEAWWRQHAHLVPAEGPWNQVRMFLGAARSVEACLGDSKVY